MSDTQTGLPFYPMKRIVHGTSTRRGLALLFINKYFDTQPIRDGAEAEIANLKKMTTEMGLSPCIFQDRTSDEVMQVLANLSNDASNSQLHSPRVRNTDDVIFIAFSSHGCKRGIQFRDNKIVPYMEIINYLNTSNCPILKGKPTILFISCCRNADERNPLETLRTDIPTIELTNDLFGRVFHPEQLGNDSFSDTFVFFSCEPNKVSIRDEIRGSIPIEILSTTYFQYANTNDFIEIFHKASENLALESKRIGLHSSCEFPIVQHMCVECNTLRYTLQIPRKEYIRPLLIDSANNIEAWQHVKCKIWKAKNSSNKTISASKLHWKNRRKPYGRRGRYFTYQYSDKPIRGNYAEPQCAYPHSLSVHNTQHTKDFATFPQNLHAAAHPITGWDSLQLSTLSSNKAIINKSLTSHPYSQPVYINTGETYDSETTYYSDTTEFQNSELTSAIARPLFEDLTTENLNSVLCNSTKGSNNKNKRLF